MDKLVYLTYPLMLFVILFGAKWSKKGSWNEEFLSLQQTKYIQGYLAVCIMLHHIGQETCASWQEYKLIPGLELFVPIGYFFVAVFFFCSGFGLYKSKQGKADYFHGFFKKRMLPLLLAFVFSNWIYVVARILMHEKMNSGKLFFYLTGIAMPNIYGWFAIIMPLFYLFFYVSFRVFKKEGWQIGSVMVCTFVYTFLGTNIDHNDFLMQGEWWYNCVHLFWIGILFAKYEKQVVAVFRKCYIVLLPLAAIFMYVTFVLSEWFMGIFSYYGEYNPTLSRFQVVGNRWICLSMQMLACGLFVLVVVLLNMKLKIGNRFLGFMGTITLEFYILHGLFLEFFSYRFCNLVPSIVRIKNVALLIVIVFALSVPAAVLFKKIIYIGKKKER